MVSFRRRCRRNVHNVGVDLLGMIRTISPTEVSAVLLAGKRIVALQNEPGRSHQGATDSVTEGWNEHDHQGMHDYDTWIIEEHQLIWREIDSSLHDRECAGALTGGLVVPTFLRVVACFQIPQMQSIEFEPHLARLHRVYLLFFGVA
ncbi:hypothetical protein Peur_021315 [Populus x canadensis]